MNLLSMADSMLFRSLVGSGIYLAQERFEIGFTIKQLAGSVSSPISGAMQMMRKLLSYLKSIKGQFNRLDYPQHGVGLHGRHDCRCVLETFTDADWSGNTAHRRSTSSGVHLINGVVVYTTSGGQKVISLSSTESELHALVGGAIDGIYLILDVALSSLCSSRFITLMFGGQLGKLVRSLQRGEPVS